VDVVEPVGPGYTINVEWNSTVLETRRSLRHSGRVGKPAVVENGRIMLHD
jgi:hypothetical protein